MADSNASCMPLHDSTAPAAPPRLAPAELVVHVGGRSQRIPYRAGDTLLETMLQANIPAAAVCAQGLCGACIVRRLQGEVALLENHVLSDADLAEGYTLACQGVPAGVVCEIAIE